MPWIVLTILSSCNRLFLLPNLFDRGFKRVAGQKVPANTIAYYNKNFLRGKPKLLKSMNGGKTKFITAREKRMRAQIKRERDQEQAVLIAAQQQSLILSDQNQNKNISGGGIGEGSMAATTVRSVGSMRSSPPGLMGGNLDVMQLRALLASSNPMALQQLQQQQLQRVDDLRMADQVFAAKQALAMQHEELQMRLLRQGNNFSNMPFLPDSAVSNQFLSSQNPTLGLHHNNNMNMDASFPGSSLVAMRLSQLQQQQRLLQSGGDSMRVPSSSIGGNDMSAEQLLLARQLSTADAGVAHGNTLSANNWAQRFMSQGGLGGSSSGLLSGLNDSISAGTLTQQGMQEAELLKRAAAADGGNSANPSAEVWASVDQQLLQMYLMQQQRKNEMSALQFNNIRQS